MPKQPGTTGREHEASYIVRVYRRSAGDIAGVVEAPVAQRRTRFRSFAELKAILTGKAPARVFDGRK